jgi:16S rRNA (guanine527-N7)-methyltransferase
LRHDRQEECLDRPRDPLPTRVDRCPPLVPAYHAALDRGLAALDLALSVEARAAIDGHVRLLLAWNAAINLTAIRDPAGIAVRHVVDSLTAVDALRQRSIGRFVDLGSGGGFPGLPLAAALPADRVLLVDSVAKKTRFLTTVVTATGLEQRVVAVAARAESFAADPTDRMAWPAVTARAVASLGELAELALPLLRAGGILVAWKRDGVGDAGPLDPELLAARRALDAIDRGATVEVTTALSDAAARKLPDLARHRLVVITRSGAPIAPGWPRDPAVRRRAPW